MGENRLGLGFVGSGVNARVHTQAFPAARIDLMLEPFSGQVIEGCPYVDRVIPFEIKTIHRYSGRSRRGSGTPNTPRVTVLTAPFVLEAMAPRTVGLFPRVRDRYPDAPRRTDAPPA